MKARSVGFLALAVAACGPMMAPEEAPVATCEVDPWKELLVVDDAVMTSTVARNDVGGALSFRNVMERLGGGRAAAMTIAWLQRWAPASVSATGGNELPRVAFRTIAIPRIPGFFIVVPIYMISEKATDVLLRDHGRPPRVAG